MSQTPQLSGSVHVASDTDQLYDDLARAMMAAAVEAAADRGVFHVALSGGSTPEPFYMRLVTDPRFRALPWEQTHLWIVDERCVPAEDDRCNYKMIRQTLADHVPMRRRQLHPMPVMQADAAAAYEHELRKVFADHEGNPRLDFVLLGMGDDGHTASLFPHSPALREHNTLIAANDGPHVTPPPRLTMTYALLNAARDLAVLVTGEKKAAMIRQIEEQLKTCPNPTELPITGIDPIDGDLTWYLDQAAAGG